MRGTVKKVALAGGLLLSTVALVAAKGGGLAAGGNTIAGPGSSSLKTGDSAVITQLMSSENVCATVANRSKSSSVRIDLVSGGTSSMTVAAGATAALCENAIDSVEVACTGTDDCSFDWRVDTY